MRPCPAGHHRRRSRCGGRGRHGFHFSASGSKNSPRTCGNALRNAHSQRLIAAIIAGAETFSVIRALTAMTTSAPRRTLESEQQQALIATVDDRVHGLGEHRGGIVMPGHLCSLMKLRL